MGLDGSDTLGDSDRVVEDGIWSVRLVALFSGLALVEVLKRSNGRGLFGTSFTTRQGLGFGWGQASVVWLAVLGRRRHGGQRGGERTCVVGQVRCDAMKTSWRRREDLVRHRMVFARF